MARLEALAQHERLYVGSQTTDRMFRGDGMRGSNFHHAQMRAGNGADTPEAMLRSGQRIEIYRLDASSLKQEVADRPGLDAMRGLLANQTKHPGYWLEQFILHQEQGNWRWNTSGAASGIGRLLRQLQ